MFRKAFFISALSTFAAACGGTDSSSGLPGPPNVDSSAAVLGSGSFTVWSDQPVAGSSVGSSYKREASFSTASCATQSMGPCTLYPCYGSSDASPPDVGQVSMSGAEMASGALAPQSNGSYSSLLVNGQLAWNAGGENMTVQWAYFPGDPGQPGGQLQVTTPPYVALTAESAFAAAPSTLSRSQDLSVAWTSDTPPSPLDQLSVVLAAGSTEISCVFDASAGTGVVPMAVLGFLDAGEGSYDVHSKAYAGQHSIGADGSQWSLSFNLDTHARTNSGLAFGSVTIQ